jgi:hypothetical protein
MFLCGQRIKRLGSRTLASRRVGHDSERSCCWDLAVRLEKGRGEGCPYPGGSVQNDATQQHNTHIRDLREICYSWHPWHGRAVWVHATLVKRGRAVAHCSLEEFQTSRVLEVPLWMLDVAACCKTRVSKPGFASAQSLGELKEVLQSALPRAQADRPETQHRYLLDAGGADGGIVGPAEIEPTAVVCSSAMQPTLDRAVVRCPAKNRAIAVAVTEAASRKSGRGNRRGGAR